MNRKTWPACVLLTWVLGCSGGVSVQDLPGTDSRSFDAVAPFSDVDGSVEDVSDDSWTPLDWAVFRMRSHGGVCGPERVCDFQWELSNGSSVVTVYEGETTYTAQLADADLLTIGGILGSREFQKAMIDGFACDPVMDASDIFVFVLPDTSSLLQEVTGCVLGSEPSQARLLYETLSKY